MYVCQISCNCEEQTGLLTVPPRADSFVVVSDGDPAEGAEQSSHLYGEDVRQGTLKLTPLQEHLHGTRRGEAHHLCDVIIRGPA